MLVVYQGCCNNDAFYFILLTTVLKLSQMGGSYELKKKPRQWGYDFNAQLIIDGPK